MRHYHLTFTYSRGSSLTTSSPSPPVASADEANEFAAICLRDRANTGPVLVEVAVKPCSSNACSSEDR